MLPNLVHVYSIAVARHALTHKAKGQRSRSRGYKTRMVARLLVTMSGIPYTCATVAGVGLHVDTTDYVF